MCIRLTEAHDGEYLAKHLSECLKHYGLKNHVKIFITCEMSAS